MSSPGTSPWHVDEATLQAYVGGQPLVLAGASVETHLMGCALCRGRLKELMPTEAVERAWSAIRAHVESPQLSLPERLVRRMGLSTELARLLVAVPAFRGAWLLGLVTVTAFAGLAALVAGDLGLTLFLIVAPLAPVAGVAASFGGDADPCHELVTVTPYSAVRLLLLRTAGVLATSLPVTLLAGLVLPGPDWVGVAWLTPAAAGVTLTLLLAPVIGATTTAATVAACWSAGVVVASRLSGPVEVVGPTMQLLSTALILVAVAALAVRQPSFEHLGRQP